MTFKLSKILVDYNVILEEDKEIYDYGLFVLIFNFLCLASMFFLGYLCQQIGFTIGFLLFYLPNRIIVGGYHCRTPKTCYMLFNLIFMLILVCNKLDLFNSFPIYIFSILIYIIYLVSVLTHDNKHGKIILVIFTIFITATGLIDILRSAFVSSVLLNSFLYNISAHIK